MYSLEHLKKNEKIVDGLFFCPKCEVIFSAYYPRTFSINCVRNANYAKCFICSGKNERKVKRLTRSMLCPDCNSKIKNNIWQKICGEELVKLTLKDFKKFCLKAVEQFSLNIYYDDYIFECLFNELSNSDFTSMERYSESGYNYGDIVMLIKKASKNIYKKKEKLAANSSRFT